MGELDTSIFKIQKLKGSSNWEQWYTDIKSCLVVNGLWPYTSGRIKAPLPPALLVVSPPPTKEAQAVYDKEHAIYEIKKDTFEEYHEKGVAYLDLTCEPGPRVHLNGLINSEEALNKLKKQYGTTDLATIDLSLQEICRTDMQDKGSVGQYAEHLKQHYNKILSAGQAIPAWMLSSFFRMGLPSHLNPYIFQLVHAVKRNNTDLTIDDMIAAFVDQDKRESYTEDRTDSARNVRNTKGTRFKCADCGKQHSGVCWTKDSDSAPQWLKDKLKWKEDQRNRAAGGGKVKRVRSTTSYTSCDSEDSGVAVSMGLAR